MLAYNSTENCAGYYPSLLHLTEKMSVLSDRSGREYLSLCRPMEMGKSLFSELL
jgi:hypothetical protein